MDELIQGLRAGEPEAFNRLVREFGDRMFRFVKRLGGERWAEDLTQEVFIRVFRSAAQFRPGGRFEAWLFTIANNLVIDRRRKRKEPSFSEVGDGVARSSVSRDQGPLELLETRERQQALLRAVEGLPFDQRQVFLLREEAGLSFKEIAELAGCPLNTALGRMHYAMEGLRKALKAYGLS